MDGQNEVEEKLKDFFFRNDPLPFLKPKTLLPLIAGAALAYEYLSNKGMIAAVRLTKNKGGQFHTQTHLDFDEGAYGGVMEHMGIVKEDRLAKAYTQRRFAEYQTKTDGGSN